MQMTFHEFAKAWRLNSDVADPLYLKDWHLVNEFPDYKVGD